MTAGEKAKLNAMLDAAEASMGRKAFTKCGRVIEFHTRYDGRPTFHGF